MTGKFITIEGAEGVGKSTNIAYIEKLLDEVGIAHIATREPGGTPLAERIRDLLLDKSEQNMDPLAELLLMFAARRQHLQELIWPALARGQWVICDRFTDSTYAYQGAGRILQPSEVARISRWATENLAPTLTVVMDIPAELGISRLRSLDRLEAEPLAFHERIRQEFLTIAGSDPERYFVVDATQDKASIHEQIIERVLSLPQLKESSAEKKRFRK